MRLRPYQREGVDRARDDLARCGRALIVLATGLGKTVMFCATGREMRAEGARKVLLLAHRDELLEQARAKWLAIEPDAVVGIYQGARRESWADVICASVQSCYPDVIGEDGAIKRRGRIHDLPLGEIDLVIVDECFPAGTSVDGVAIEIIQVGDMVRSFNHETGMTEMRRVTNVFRSIPKQMVTVHCEDGRSFVCTSGHPFFNGVDYTPAVKLRTGDALYGDSSEDMRGVFDRVRSEVVEQHDDPDLLGDVQTDQAGSSQGSGHRHMQVVREHIRGATWRKDESPNQARDEFVFGRVREGVEGREERGDDGIDEPPMCGGAHEGEKPHALRDSPPEDARLNHCHRSRAEGSRGQRHWPDQGRVSDDVCPSRVVVELRCPRRDGASERLADALQNRRGQPRDEDRNRGRRVEPLPAGSAGRRQEKGRISPVARVDSVEVHESTGGVGPGCLCPDGYVYNIEVEGNHNYFVNGVLVHNCHRIVSPTYEAVLESVIAANPNVGILAVTATPARADGKGLGKWFDRVSYRMGIKEGIDGGYLAPLRGVRVELQIDLSEVKIARNGDFDDTDLGRVLDTDSAREHIVAKWLEMVGPGSEDGGPGGRFTAAFSPTVAAAEHLAAEFERAGVSAGVVSGTTKKKDRKRILDAYQHREIRVLCNVGVLTEGWDAPHTDCILMARPTKSGVLYRQAVGRGTRLSDGKADCIVLDCVGANALGLQTVLDLSTPGADRVPGVDPEPEDELTLDDGEQISMDVGDEIEARRVVGVTAYEIDMLGGGVHWVRCMSARVATVDVGKSMVVYPDRGAWSAMLFRGREVDIIAERRPERETMRAAEAICAEIGVPRMLVPTTYRARMPATEKQIQMLGVLVERNTAKAPLDLSAMPAPNRMGAHQIGAWISYLHARMVLASRSASKGRDMNETQSTVSARGVET